MDGHCPLTDLSSRVRNDYFLLKQTRNILRETENVHSYAWPAGLHLQSLGSDSGQLNRIGE